MKRTNESPNKYDDCGYPWYCEDTEHIYMDGSNGVRSVWHKDGTYIGDYRPNGEDVTSGYAAMVCSMLE